MRGFLTGTVLGALMVAALVTPLPQVIMTSFTAAASNAAARVMPAAASNGETGSFVIPGGELTQVTILRHQGLCLRSRMPGVANFNPLRWRLRSTGAWIPHRGFSYAAFDAMMYDMVEYHPPTAIEMERLFCSQIR